jgi:hypothetical protein
LSCFLRICSQSSKKVLIWPKKKFFWKNRKRCQKRRISRWFRIRWKSFEKMYQNKVISKNVTEKCPFFTFIHVRQTCFAYNFFLVHFFTTFSTDSKSAWNSAFLTPFAIFFKKNIFLGHISTFFELWSQTRKKRLKKSKNVFCKCVLDFNFAPIKGSVFFIF